MTRSRAATTIRLLAILCWATFGATAAGADGNAIQQACETLGGVYQQREGGDPDQAATHMCRFPDGSGRLCDAQGNCGPILSREPRDAADTDERRDDGEEGGTGDSVDRAACEEARRGTCEDRCRSKNRREAAGCASSCLDELCGDSSGRADSSCRECMDTCEQQCRSARNEKQQRKCESRCERSCAEQCDPEASEGR